MTLTFKDPNGVEWRLWAWAMDGKFDARLAEPADLLAALGQLSTGSGGPTDEELRALFAQVLQAGGWTLEAVRASEVGGFRALYNAGLALGEQKLKAQGWRHVPDTHEVIPKGRHEWVLKSDLDAAKAEVDRLTARVAEQRGRIFALTDELAATKAKLADAVLERDALIGLDRGAADYATLQEQIATHGASALVTVSRFEHNKLHSELASARRVVESAKHWASLDHDDGATYRECVEASKKLQAAAEALASAGTDADRAEAPRDEAGESWPIAEGDIVEVHDACCDPTYECTATVLRILPKGKYAEVRIHGREPGPGEAYPVRKVVSLRKIGAHATEEPKPEPQPSGERPFWDSPLPWRIVDEEDFATLVRIVDANGENVARCASDDDARFIVARCNESAQRQPHVESSESGKGEQRR